MCHLRLTQQGGAQSLTVLPGIAAILQLHFLPCRRRGLSMSAANSGWKER